MVTSQVRGSSAFVLWSYTLRGGRQPTLGEGGTYFLRQQGSMRSKAVGYFANTEAGLVCACS